MATTAYLRVSTGTQGPPSSAKAVSKAPIAKIAGGSLPPFTALSRQGGYAHTLKGYFYTNLGGTLLTEVFGQMWPIRGLRFKYSATLRISDEFAGPHPCHAFHRVASRAGPSSQSGILRNGEKARSAGLFCPTISRLLTRMGSRGTGDSQSP